MSIKRDLDLKLLSSNKLSSLNLHLYYVYTFDFRNCIMPSNSRFRHFFEHPGLPKLSLPPTHSHDSLKASIPPKLLKPYLDHLATPLLPLVSCIEGLPHPDFPQNLLQYHLLTSTQLDNLARHFHQVSPPRPESACYPIQVSPWMSLDPRREIDLQTKRRRFGRFIGLRDCESPVQSTSPGVPWVYKPELEPCESSCDELAIDPFLMGVDGSETVDQMLERMQRDWDEALALAGEEGRLGLGFKE